jgi:hypothetical protein
MLQPSTTVLPASFASPILLTLERETREVAVGLEN